MFKKWFAIFKKDSLIDRAYQRSFKMMDITRSMYIEAKESLRYREDSEVDLKLKETDKEVNSYEREVRRMVFKHLSVTGTANLPQGFILVSIIIDIERIGDYAKNMVELALDHPGKLHGGEFEGEITRIDFAKDGVIMSRALDHEHWHNRVKTSYTDYLLGTPTATAWAVNTSSSRMFGGCEYIDTVGRNYGTESACTVRDTRLTERAFPRTLPVGVTQELGARLMIHCSGYVFSMNRRYRESDIAASPISSHITTLAGAAEFVTPGRVVATGASAAVKASAVPERLWPIAEELVLVGGSANERWVGGVWAGRQFHYEPAETEVTHYWRQGKLYTRAWSRVHPCFVTPNSIVRSCGFSESLPGGDLVWDSARDFYVEEVEYSIQDNQARLTPYGGGYPLVVGG